MTNCSRTSVPVYVTILNPAVVFALTVEVIEPSLLDEPVPPAFQDQPTAVPPLAFISVLVPIDQPSELKEVTYVASVPSALVKSD